MLRKSVSWLRTNPKSSSGWTAPGSVSGLHRLGPPPQTTAGNLRRKDEVFSRWFARVVVNTFEEKPADDKSLGGDHYTGKQDAMNQLKMMDRRLQTFKHTELMANTLKCVVSLDGPNGQKVQPSIVQGRVVGILVFGDEERSTNFFSVLEQFHKKHKDDFVVICISHRMTEAQHMARQHGFHHCTFRNGAAMVIRDLSLMLYPGIPLPRLCIVDGSTGFLITKSGYTAVLTNPDSCFGEWAEGRSGCNWYDFPKTWWFPKQDSTM